MKKYLEKLQQRPLVLDGAMGTVIYERGVFVNTCYDELVLTRPDLILGIHREYVEAGADLLLTNTFGANRMKLKPFGLADQVERICRAAVELARRAAGDSVLVAGDMGPCTAFGFPLTDAAIPEATAAFEEQVAALVAAGVDLIFLETFSDLRELLLAAAVAYCSGLPVHASFTVNDEGESAVGHSARVFLDALHNAPHVSSIGLNCGMGPAGLFELAESLLPGTDKPLLVKPNAGLPREVGGRMLYMTSPEYFTEYAKRFIELGVRGVGGCCGTTPAHIREAAKAVKSLSGVKRHMTVRPLTSDEQAAIKPVPLAEKSRFAAKLARGDQVTSVEVLPPRSPDMSALLEKIRACHFAGVDAINIPDGPRASARVSPMVAALLIKNAIGIEPIPHYCCRDRNLLGMQSDVLGAAAAGLNNLLVITGDSPKTGDYPDVTGVFDIDAVGLTQMVANLNNGYDFGGNRLATPTALCIGVGANPCAIDLDREIDRYFAKIEAGAEYAITQPVFDAESLLRFAERTSRNPDNIPIVAGIWPLANYKNAEFMRNEVPGVVIPDSVMERLADCTSRDDARKIGIEIAREIMDEIAPAVAGFQVSAPLGNVNTALQCLL